ncbi:unnamed protein product [Coregonus sp. 'balchen']|nr:unnamed protein product [Coregonus sp. 'balchen']
MVTGGLLYHWMTEILRYDSGTSSTAACIYSVAILFVSYLCHPLCCGPAHSGHQTVMQADHLHLCSVMVLVLNAIKVKQEELNIITRQRKCDQFDVSEVKKRFVTVSKLIERDFLHAKKLLEEYKLLSNRILVANFAIYRIVQLRFPGLCIIPAICGDTELANFHKQYDWTFSPEALLCDVEPSAPHLRVRVLLTLLCLVGYIMVFLEVYTRSILRKVSASFFKKQEENIINLF